MIDFKADKPLDDSDNPIDNNSSGNASHSSADNVEQYLLGLESSQSYEENKGQLEDLDLDDDELASVINLQRLQDLLKQSDGFLGHLSGEIDDFDGSINGKHEQ